MDNPWFVIAGSHKSKESAQKQVIALKEKGYQAEVYDPFGGSDYYGVVIGSYLTLDEAKELQKKAIADGLPKDTYIWKWR